MTSKAQLDPVYVFLSSPNDIAERQALAEVIHSFSDCEISGQRFRCVPLLWEKEVPAVVGDAPQFAVDFYLGKASQVDVYIGLFWQKLGSPAVIQKRRFESGTLYEFQDAYASYRQSGRPRMLLYRCMRAGSIAADVDKFFASFRGEYAQFEGLPAEYQRSEEIVERVRNDLRMLLQSIAKERLEEASTSPATRLGKASRQVLIDSIQSFLSNYEDLFGAGGEKEHRFPMSFKTDQEEENPAITAAGPIRSGELVERFERQNRRLMIIGTAGGGKTFAMLQLMQDLLNRARRDEHAAVPLFFNLSSWALTWTLSHRETVGHRFQSELDPSENNTTLDDWAIDELVRWYSVPRSAARKLVNNRQIILCLDGLDELLHGSGLEDAETDLTAELQRECVATLNRTLADRSVQVILCCREDTFHRLPVPPELGKPICTQPLELADVLSYLREWTDLDGLRAAITESSALQQKSQLPLFLRLMATAYSGLHKDAILDMCASPPDEWRHHLMDNYVRQCLQIHTLQGQAYTKRDIPRYLGWLADNTPAAFLVEDLQPSLLRPFRNKRGDAYVRYRRRSSAALATILAMTVCIPASIAIGIEWAALHSLEKAITYGGIVLLVTAAAAFCISWPAFAAKTWYGFGCLIGCAFGIVRGSTIALSPTEGLGGTWQEGLSAFLVSAPCAAVIFALFGYQTLGKIERYRKRYRNRPGIEDFEVMPVETYDWQWFDRENWWRGGWLGLIIGPLTGLAFWITFGPARGFGFGAFVTILVTIFSGLGGTGVRVSLSPNQGIRRSFLHATLASSSLALSSVAIFSISYGITFGLLDGVVNAILGLGAACTFLVFGGIPVVRHICIGNELHSQGVLPNWYAAPPWKKTVTFLDDMVRFKLLRRSAGGYTFRHDFIRQYFRPSQDPPP